MTSNGWYILRGLRLNNYTVVVALMTSNGRYILRGLRLNIYTAVVALMTSNGWYILWGSCQIMYTSVVALSCTELTEAGASNAVLILSLVNFEASLLEEIKAQQF